MGASCGKTDQYSEQMLVEVHKSQITATANSVSGIRSSFGSAKMSQICVGLTPLDNISNYLAPKLAWKPKSIPMQPMRWQCFVRDAASTLLRWHGNSDCQAPNLLLEDSFGESQILQNLSINSCHFRSDLERNQVNSSPLVTGFLHSHTHCLPSHIRCTVSQHTVSNCL